MISSILTYFGLDAGQSCSFPNSSFLGFPHWYQYLPGQGVSTDAADRSAPVVCNPQLGNLSDVWLIIAAIIEILLRVAAIAAVAMVIYGAVKYIASQGEPDKTTQARSTIINALIGLMLSVMATVFVAFIAGSIN
jgi:hypothetical protein